MSGSVHPTYLPLTLRVSGPSAAVSAALQFAVLVSVDSIVLPFIPLCSLTHCRPHPVALYPLHFDPTAFDPTAGVSLHVSHSSHRSMSHHYVSSSSQCMCLTPTTTVV